MIVKKSGMNTKFLIIFCTIPDEDSALAISKALVSEKLAACCNIVRGLRSIYSWKETVHDDSELLLLIKSKTSAFEKLERRIIDLHPYQVPEILAVPVYKGNENYLKWIEENVS